MKALCIKLLDSLGRETSSSPWLKVGATYDVLSISVDERGRCLFRIAADQQDDPGLFSSTQFELVDNSLPTIWTITLARGGGMFLGPSEWAKPGFWEAYFDGDEQSRQVYRRDRSAITDP